MLLFSLDPLPKLAGTPAAERDFTHAAIFLHMSAASLVIQAAAMQLTSGIGEQVCINFV